MSNFNNDENRLLPDSGFVHEREDEEQLLSDYWDWDDWNKLTDAQKESWLDEFWLNWKANCESGSVLLEDGE